MHTDLPKTINEALKILAYNDYFWLDTFIENFSQNRIKFQMPL